MDKEKEKGKNAEGAKAEGLENRIAELTAALDAAKGKKILPEEKRAPLWRRVCGGVIWTVLCLAFAVMLIITVTAAVAKAKGDRAEVLGYGIFVVVTGSMEPEIKIDDIIITKKVAQDKIEKGDDIAFYSSAQSKVITHRVIEVTERGYITQGLQNNVADGEILYSDVLGKVVLKSSFLGAVYKFVSSQYGFLFVIVVPLFFFVVYESWVLGKKFKALKKADKEEKDEADKDLPVNKGK